MKHIIRILAFAFTLMGGCEELVLVGGIEPEINFQEGTVQGVRTGDDTSIVVQKLGRPDWIALGDYDGFAYCYEDWIQPGIEMMFVTFFNRSNVLNNPDYRVSGISVLNNYKGKSKEGIGVHLLRSQVRKKLGIPDLIQPEYDLEQYYFTWLDTLKNAATFLYDENQCVRSIGVDTRKR